MGKTWLKIGTRVQRRQGATPDGKIKSVLGKGLWMLPVVRRDLLPTCSSLNALSLRVSSYFLLECTLLPIAPRCQVKQDFLSMRRKDRVEVVDRRHRTPNKKVRNAHSARSMPRSRYFPNIAQLYWAAPVI